MSSGLANFVTSEFPGNASQLLVSIHGVGGVAYAGLKKGTSPYRDGIGQVNRARAIAAAIGRPYRVTAVTVIHGETDNVNKNSAKYEGYLTQWQHDYDTDVRAITGQSEPIPMFTDQMSASAGYSIAASEIPIAQLAASEHNPGKIVLVGPKYQLTYADTFGHLRNTSYRWLGDYYG